MNFAKLNHIFVPADAKERNRVLELKKWIILKKLFDGFLALTVFGRFFIFFWLFSVAMGMNMSWSVYYYVTAASTAILAVALIFRRFYTLKDTEITIIAPHRVIKGETIEFECLLKNRSQNDYDAIDIDPPFLTWDGKYFKRPGFIQILKSKQSVIVSCKARFSARGMHSLMPFTARQVDFTGIAGGPGVKSGLVNFMVVPKIAEVKSLKPIYNMRYQPGGITMASNTGEAMELVGVRPYRPGDPLKNIHAKTWAKTGNPYVKEFHQEYFSRVAVIIDSRTDKKRVDEESFEAAISLSAGCMTHLVLKENIVELIVLPAIEKRSVLVGRNIASVEQGLDFLAVTQPENVSANKKITKEREETLFLSKTHLWSAAIIISLSKSKLSGDLYDTLIKNKVDVYRLFVSKKNMPEIVPDREGIVFVATDDILKGRELFL